MLYKNAGQINTKTVLCHDVLDIYPKIHFFFKYFDILKHKITCIPYLKKTTYVL
jgi:hypothetical protein